MYSKYPELPGYLPERITLSDGDTRTQLHLLSDAELAEYGYYPVTFNYPNLEIGQQYGVPELVLDNGTVIATYPIEQAPIDWRITRLAFLNRFTDAEAIAIDLASIGATVQAATFRRFMSKVNNAEFIDLSRSDTIAGVQYLETQTILSNGRASVILTTIPSAIEQYRG